MVIWIVGRSGSGKSTLADKVIALARKQISNLTLLDGDAVRAVFGNDLGHEVSDRKVNASRLCQLSRFLADEGIHVVAAVASAFEESRAWNRENINGYYEVLIDCPMEQLIARDSKGLYKRALAGEILLTGVNQHYEPPEHSDEIIHNTGSLESLLSNAPRLADMIVNAQ